MEAMISRCSRFSHQLTVPHSVKDYVEGIETGICAYFNGERFLQPGCLDWEHKRFFTGKMGDLTGGMGKVATFTRSTRLFDAALRPLK